MQSYLLTDKLVGFVRKPLCCRKIILPVVIIISCSFQTINAQTRTIDSLKKILPSLKDSARIDCLNELGAEFSDRYWSISKYQQTDTACMYTLQAMKESQMLHYSKGVGKAFLNMSLIEEEHGNFKGAKDYVEKALSVLQKGDIASDYHRARIFYAYCMYHCGFFEQGIETIKNEVPYYEFVKDSAHLAMICRMIGSMYDMMGNSENAFPYFQKNFIIQNEPKDLFSKMNSPTYKARIYLAAGDTANAILCYKQAIVISSKQYVSLEAYYQQTANIYRLQKKYDSALMKIREGVSYIQSKNTDSLFRKAALMTSYGDLSSIFSLLKKFDSSTKYGLQALTFFKEGSDVVALLPALKTVAAAYNSKKENSSALIYANQLLTYAQHSGAKKFERDAYELLWKIYTEQNEMTLAKNYHLKYMLLNDSLQNDKYISQAAALKAINDITINEVKYENQLKINEERNNAKIDAINIEKKTQLYIFISAISLLGLFVFLLIRNTGLKRKKDQLQLMMTEANIELEKQKSKQEVAQLNQQKTELELQALRAQMNPHFIFNCLNSINRFIITNEATKAADYLTKFAKLIRIVLEQSGKAFVPLEDELKCLQLYMDLEALRFATPFKYEINYNGTDVSSVMIPTLLLQPFVENAIWHGLQGNKNTVGKIDITMHVHDNMLYCKICDNGIGRAATTVKENKEPGKRSMGLALTKHRLQLIDSNEHEKSGIEIYDLVNENGSSGGTCVDIKIPVKEI